MSNLSHSRQMLMGARQGCFFSNGKVKVNQLVAKSGKFVAKANSVGSRVGWLPLESVKLLLHTLVKNFTTGAGQSHIDIILAAGDYLQRQTFKSSIAGTISGARERT